ncbi:MAG: hypothetical protein CM1200mP24_10140 [Gammaproteobacteria bacterium]|nr:MAG: hypothetical protein CM1200mP24_10140 [Gammaproteobacteria bacterium]
MLTAWMQDYVPPAHQYEERPGRWIAEPMWPSPNIENQSFWLGKNSLELNSVNAGSLSNDHGKRAGHSQGTGAHMDTQVRCPGSASRRWERLEL